MKDNKENTINNLLITLEEFELGYNYDFTPALRADFNGSDYLSWSNVTMMFKRLFPCLVCEVTRTEETYDAEGKANGVMIYTQIRDIRDNSVSPEGFLPVMDNRNNSQARPCARKLSDNIQRAMVKTIAINTGLGLRLWSREGIDSKIGDKNSNKDHLKFKLILRINELMEQVLSNTAIKESELTKPHFGMSAFELKELGKKLSELIPK